MDNEKCNYETFGRKPKFKIGDEVWIFTTSDTAQRFTVRAIESFMGIIDDNGTLAVYIYYVVDWFVSHKRIEESTCYSWAELNKEMDRLKKEHPDKSKLSKVVTLLDFENK